MPAQMLVNLGFVSLKTRRKERMNLLKRYKYLLAVTIVGLVGFSAALRLNAAQASDERPDKAQFLTQLVSYIIGQWHYDPKAIDDSLSVSVYDEYLKTLDFGKRYFTQADSALLDRYRYEIDDQILAGDTMFFHSATSVFKTRMEMVAASLDSLLATPMDFTVEETLDPNDTTYARDMTQVMDRWRRYLKYNVLTRLYSDLKTEEDKASKDSTYVAKTTEELEKKAREAVLKNFRDYFKRIDELDEEDWFSMYLNAFTMYFDPHTQYMAPREEKDFNTSISGQLEGIGAVLQQKDGYTTIASIVPGSPAAKSGQLAVGDQILEVAQGNDEYVNIVGMRLDDAVDLIRGKKGSTVRLKVQQADGAIKEVPLVRDVVELEETFVRSAVVEKDGRKYGVIYVPKFYVNFENEDGRESSDDLAKEIAQLKKEGIEGIVLDLRNNTGGALTGAVKMGGLFIDQGPIVQVKTREGQIRVLPDNDPSVAWDGPLVVLVNEISASASEIFAGAMKDYNRAIIVGSKQTYGKGSVQNIVELDNMVRGKLFGDDALGALRLTIEKFYRVNGAGNQLRGVASDVEIPDVYSVIEMNESTENLPMPWDSIPAARYYRLDNDFAPVIERARARIEADPYFQQVQENIAWLKSRKESRPIPLSLEGFRQDDSLYRAEAKRFDSINKFRSELEYVSPQYEQALSATDSTLASKRKTWHEDLRKDAAMQQAVEILSDIR